MNPTDINAPPIIRQLPLSLQNVATTQLNEKQERVAEDILTLRHWIHKEPHLRARTNDQLLLGFLRGSKFSLEKAKKKIDRYYTLRAGIPEIFNERRQVEDPTVMEIVRLGVILQIQFPADYAGPCVTIIRACSYDTNKYKFADIIRVGTMFGEIMTIEDDNSTISGYIEIMDMSNVSATHLFQLKPDLLRKLSIYAEEAMPMRQRETPFINVPPSFQKGFDTIKNIFPDKMTNRIFVNSEPEGIFEHVPREYLPMEYGGSNGTIQDIIDRMEMKLSKYQNYFLEESNYGTDEKLRDGQPFDYENYFGIDGSFRKLEID